jgi:hypothetical protein
MSGGVLADAHTPPFPKPKPWQISRQSCRFLPRIAYTGIGTMRPRPAHLRPRAVAVRNAQGVSLLEPILAAAIVLLISSMAITPVSKTLKVYQLNDAATQVAGILKFTRFEAIRKNTPLKCLNSQATPAI